MKKTSAFIILIVFSLFSISYGEERLFQGQKMNGQSVDPSVIAVYKGPDFPESEFEKLKLPEQFWGAYYRVIYSYGEIYYCITAELIGLYEESMPEVIDSYLIPLLGESDNCIKGGVGFNEWKDYRTFETDDEWKKTIRIYQGGKFSITDSASTGGSSQTKQ